VVAVVVEEEEESPMAKSYDQVMAPRRAQQTPADAARLAVFGQAYDIAVQIVELRERHGLTQAELAERCGIDQGDISRIERGATNPPPAPSNASPPPSTWTSAWSRAT
jgi:ribosome-binding protein aMBF1 (putative translation factor)